MDNPLSELFRLFFPEQCAACGRPLHEGVRVLCPHCRWEMPQTGYCSVHDNPVYHRFGGLAQVEEASAFLFFSGENRFRDLIHSFKYRGQWRNSLLMGELLGHALREGALYDSVDGIIPIPLHPRRRLQRGYNQAEYLAKGVASVLGRPLLTHNVIRRRYNPSQTHTQHDERWDNVQGIFAIRHPETLSGKHLLLIDDVLTTGATLISCATLLLQEIPDSKISIATFAVSAHELFGREKGGGL